MNGSPTFQHLTQQTLDEHRQIHFFLDQLETALETLRVVGRDVEPLRRLAAQLESLCERLEEHFAGERDGLFPAIVDALPPMEADVRRLQEEHEALIASLQVARIHAQRADGTAAESLCDDLQEVLGRLRRHEREEEALLARAIGEEQRRNA